MDTLTPAQPHIGGLRIKKIRDPRAFKFHKTFGSVAADQFPSKFELVPKGKIKDQGQTNFCTAYAVTTASEPQEGVELSPDFQVGMTGLVAGAPILNGTDMDTALKPATRYGSLKQSDAPWSWERNGQWFVADPNNWSPELRAKALEHKKGSYFTILTGPHDKFDNIRSGMMRSKQYSVTKGVSPSGAVVGFVWRTTDWNYAPGGIVPKVKGNAGTMGHAFVLIGWETINNEPYLVGQLSSGPEFGNGGLYYFPREVVNRDCVEARMLVDYDPNDVRQAQWNLLQVMADYLIALSHWIRRNFGRVFGNITDPRTLRLQIQALWERVFALQRRLEKAKTEELVRRICDEEGMTPVQKELIVAVIWAESGMDPNAKNRNTDGTYDLGLIQANTYWYIYRMKLLTEEEAMDPEKSVRVMCQRVKEGFITDWWAYRNGSYRRHLKVAT
jgi:hypothetical protein